MMESDFAEPIPDRPPGPSGIQRVTWQANQIAHPDTRRDGRPESTLLLRNLNDIEPVPLRWLWPGVVPLGKLTMLVGDPGLGKSLVTIDIASRVSRGDSWPCGGASRMGGVLLLSAEDDPADTIRPRLDVMHADIKRIDLIAGVKRPRGKVDAFNISGDIAALDRALSMITNECAPVQLIIIDPITAYTGGIDSNMTSDVRGLLAPLAELAARHAVAVLAVSHLNKGSGTAIYRTTGSLAWVAASRAVWAVGRDRDDPERILMLPVKQNLSPDEGGFAYRILAEEGVPAISWEPGRVRGDANELLCSSENSDRRLAWKEAESWIREKLASGSRLASDILNEAETEGFSRKSVWTATKRLRVVKEKTGYQGASQWSLPPEDS